MIKPVNDDRAECNWSIFVDDLGTADGDLAHRAAINVHETVSARFDLAVD